MDSYSTLKLVHIVSSTVLFGTGLGTAFYMWRAHRSGDPLVIAAVARNVVLAYGWFTAPAAIVQPVTGFWLMSVMGYSFTLPWLSLSLLLYGIAGVCWLPVVYIQIKLRNLAQQAAAAGTELPPMYHGLMRYWFLLGWVAFASLLYIFYLMIFRPV
jgi:uncharacterized membrane protein